MDQQPRRPMCHLPQRNVMGQDAGGVAPRQSSQSSSAAARREGEDESACEPERRRRDAERRQRSEREIGYFDVRPSTADPFML